MVETLTIKFDRAIVIFTLRAKLSGAVYFIGPVCVFACLQRSVGRAVSESYYSQRARSICVSLRAFFINLLIVLYYIHITGDQLFDLLL